MTATIGDLLSAYLEYARAELKTFQRLSWTASTYLSNLTDTPAVSLSRQDVERLRDSLATIISQKTANNVIELILASYSRAIRAGTIPGPNPASGLKFKLNRRERMMQSDILSASTPEKSAKPNELARFFLALSAVRNKDIRDYFIVLVFSGEQKSRVLTMQWKDIDLRRGIWFIDQRKRQPRSLYLLPEVIKILERKKHDSGGYPWVFPGTGRTGHLRRVDKAWSRIVKTAELQDLRLDDLRKIMRNPEPARLALAEYYRPLPGPATPVKRSEGRIIASSSLVSPVGSDQLSRSVGRPTLTVVSGTRQKQRDKPALKSPMVGPPPVPVIELDPGEVPGPNLKELFETYWQLHASVKAKTARKIRRDYERYLASWDSVPAKKIRVIHVHQLHNYWAQAVGQSTANSVVSLLKAIYNRAIKWELIDCRNPTSAVEPFRQQSRERFLAADEIERLMRSLAYCRDTNFRSFVKVALFTSARVSNVQAMRWQDIDFERKFWRIPITKNGRSHTIPLPPQAVEAIESQQGEHPVWVFPGRGKTGHMVNPNKSWHRLLECAGITDARMHDLRRTLASWQAITGASLPIIGKTLGHSNPKATVIYARLNDAPVRQAMEKAIEAMLRAGVY